MKRLILLLCFGIISTIAGYSPASNTLTIENKPPFKPFTVLMEATACIESSGDTMALNRLEMAYGLYQIRNIRLVDYNRRTGKSYSLQDCYNKKISDEIYIYYACKFHPSDYESISKAWNGRGQSNKIYWAKVKKQIETQSKNNR